MTMSEPTAQNGQHILGNVELGIGTPSALLSRLCLADYHLLQSMKDDLTAQRFQSHEKVKNLDRFVDSFKR